MNIKQMVYGGLAALIMSAAPGCNYTQSRVNSPAKRIEQLVTIPADSNFDGIIDSKYIVDSNGRIVATQYFTNMGLLETYCSTEPTGQYSCKSARF